MLRSGFILSVSAPAAILTMLVHPVVKSSFDRPAQQPVAVSASVAVSAAPLPGMRPVSIAISPTRIASLGADRARATTGAVETAQEMGKDLSRQPLKPRRPLMREGCEGALSSLVGPEARRMTPGRCIS